jgi:hypothetical protein
MMDPLTALAAFGPLAVDLGKALISKFISTDTFKPSNVAEWLQMRSADVELFQAMNTAGGTSSGYPWVEAFVRLQRPVVATIVLGTWAASHLWKFNSPAIDNFAGAVGFYLFGDRTLFHSKRTPSGSRASGGSGWGQLGTH